MPFTMQGNVAVFDLPDALTHLLPSAYNPFYVVAQARLVHAHHGPNVVNEGPTITYVDPFGKIWSEQGEGAIVEAHGAVVWAEYTCEGGWPDSGLDGTAEVEEYAGECVIPPDRPSEVVLRVRIFNEGDAIAKAVAVTQWLPNGVRLVDATPLWAYTTTDQVVWDIGDLAPGGSKSFQIVLQIDPAEGERVAQAGLPTVSATVNAQALDRVLAVRRSDGEFLDDFSDQVLRGQIGDAFSLRLGRGVWQVYLPVVARNHVAAPDLVVQDVLIAGNTVQVVIANQGNTTVVDDFWVDLYINPNPVPVGTNQVWHLLCDEGLVWGVTEDLAPGQTLVLDLNSPYFDATHTHFSSTFSTGMAIYVQADSAHTGTTYGGVLETHELTGGTYNNIYGPVVVTSDIGTTAGMDVKHLPTLPGALPARP